MLLNLTSKLWLKTTSSWPWHSLSHDEIVEIEARLVRGELDHVALSALPATGTVGGGGRSCGIVVDKNDETLDTSDDRELSEPFGTQCRPCRTEWCILIGNARCRSEHG